jgi:hypothetical protein
MRKITTVNTSEVRTERNPLRAETRQRLPPTCVPRWTSRSENFTTVGFHRRNPQSSTSSSPNTISQTLSIEVRPYDISNCFSRWHPADLVLSLDHHCKGKSCDLVPGDFKLHQITSSSSRGLRNLAFCNPVRRRRDQLRLRLPHRRKKRCTQRTMSPHILLTCSLLFSLSRTK